LKFLGIIHLPLKFKPIWLIFILVIYPNAIILKPAHFPGYTFQIYHSSHFTLVSNDVYMANFKSFFYFFFSIFWTLKSLFTNYLSHFGKSKKIQSHSLLEVKLCAFKSNKQVIYFAWKWNAPNSGSSFLIIIG